MLVACRLAGLSHGYPQIRNRWSRRWSSGPSETAHPACALSFALRSWTYLATAPCNASSRSADMPSMMHRVLRGLTASPAANMAQSVNRNLTFHIEVG